MDIFTLTKSRTRQKILNLFLSNPSKDYYLRELEKELSISAGNIRREFLNLLKLDLFQRYSKGRLIYYKLNTKSVLYHSLKMLMNRNAPITKSIIGEGYAWIIKPSPVKISEELYCQTRDIFQVRLESYGTHLEEKIGVDAYLITAIAGEIGNNSFDHNLGQWLNIPGVFFAQEEEKKFIVLADRGQGILKTISRVRPEVKTHGEALNVAFTQIISGRSPEKRGNGLKFVTQVIKDRNWSLQFDSGNASLTIDSEGIIRINIVKRNIQGCFAVIRY